MRILHVIPQMGCGGAEILLGSMAVHQARRGHRITIVSLRSHHESFNHFPDKDSVEKEIELIVVPSGLRLFSLRNQNSFLKDWITVLHRVKPDIIHSHVYEADLIAHSVIPPHTAYLSHIHGQITQLEKHPLFPKSIKDFYVRFEKRWIFRRFKKCNTHFVTNSHDIFNYTKTIVPPSLIENIHLCQNAIDLKNFPFRKRNISSPLKLVTTGNLVGKKNHEFLIRVVDSLLREGTDCELNILGWGELESSLRDLIAQLGLQEKVMLKGSVGNVNDYLQRAEVYVHAAQPEPFGLAILEAMSTGLPVVTLDGGGNRDLINSGVNGFMIEEKNIERFAEKILLLKDDSALYDQISNQAAETARQFDMENYVDRMMELYMHVIDSRIKK